MSYNHSAPAAPMYANRTITFNNQTGRGVLKIAQSGKIPPYRVNKSIILGQCSKCGYVGPLRRIELFHDNGKCPNHGSTSGIVKLTRFDEEGNVVEVAHERRYKTRKERQDILAQWKSTYGRNPRLAVSIIPDTQHLHQIEEGEVFYEEAV